MPRGRSCQPEVEMRAADRAGNPEFPGFSIGLIMPNKIADQRVLDREDRIALEIWVGAVENMRRHRFVAVGGDNEMDMRRPPRMTPGRLQHMADRPIRRDRVVDPHYRA